MLAVIEVNSKQYVVKEGDKIKIESPTVGEIKILLLAEGENVKVGAPYVDGKVATKILEQGRDKKKIVFHYHSKTRHRKKAGHRQDFTSLEVVSIK